MTTLIVLISGLSWEEKVGIGLFGVGVAITLITMYRVIRGRTR